MDKKLNKNYRRNRHFAVNELNKAITNIPNGTDYYRQYSLLTFCKCEEWILSIFFRQKLIVHDKKCLLRGIHKLVRIDAIYFLLCVVIRDPEIYLLLRKCIICVSAYDKFCFVMNKRTQNDEIVIFAELCVCNKCRLISQNDDTFVYMLQIAERLSFFLRGNITAHC